MISTRLLPSLPHQVRRAQRMSALGILGSHLLVLRDLPCRNACSETVINVETMRPREKGAHLDLIYINLAILFSHLLVRDVHSIECSHRILEIFCHEGSGLHVEGLLSELRQLRFIHALLLECPESALLNSILVICVRRSKNCGGRRVLFLARL